MITNGEQDQAAAVAVHRQEHNGAQARRSSAHPTATHISNSQSQADWCKQVTKAHQGHQQPESACLLRLGI